VLRLAKIPAVLVECGFTTSEFESHRIALNEFNMIEAWGIFRGICRYLANGIPDIKFIKSLNDTSSQYINLSFGIKDPAGVDLKSIKIYIDSVSYGYFTFNPMKNLLLINYPAGNYGSHTIKIIASNNKGNYAFPFYYNIFVENKTGK
jgi:hypothetical protein